MPSPPSRGIIFAVSLMMSCTLPGEVVTLDSIADTSLFEFDPDYNFGRQRTIPAGSIGSMAGADGARSRALFKFAVSGAIPPGATIQSARISLSISTQLPPGRAISDFALNRVLVSWNEGDGFGENPGGREAIAGETTWNNRMHPSTPWSVPGGAFGVDFSVDAGAIATGINGSGVTPTTYHFNLNATGLSDLSQMIAGLLPNHGWLLSTLSEGTQKTARRWVTHETINEGPAPALQITFTPPPDPVLNSCGIDESTQEFWVRLDGVTGFRYQLQCGTDLANWLPTGVAQTPASNGELEFRISMTEARKFVRIERTLLP